MLAHMFYRRYLILSPKQPCGVSLVFILIFGKIELQLREVNLP